ncbi:hypothetical protein H072_5330 [Dactylellina haptotyla CBS 200.50]|uniref:Uncharacterized protein n=1 Tax=Dactylellina haptotyla (strain CBS 200.50) TaxID=1284197 RepID=S8ACU5_DACHA|nr:hypothetical protein H072_5330 [Dactylellina haptotyla CBS 200.50]
MNYYKKSYKAGVPNYKVTKSMADLTFGDYQAAKVGKSDRESGDESDKDKGIPDVIIGLAVSGQKYLNLQAVGKLKTPQTSDMASFSIAINTKDGIAARKTQTSGTTDTDPSSSDRQTKKRSLDDSIQGSSSGFQYRAVYPSSSQATAAPLQEIEPAVVRSKNTKENIAATGSRSTGPLSERLSELIVDIASGQRVEGSSMALSSPNPLLVPPQESDFSLTTETPTPDAQKQESQPTDLSHLLTPSSCMVTSHSEDNRDKIIAVFNPTSTTGLGRRRRVWKGDLTWLATGNVYPVYFKVFKEEDPYQSWDWEQQALERMKGTGASADIIIWGHTKGNEDISSGYIIGTTPVEGETHEPEWWLDPRNAFWFGLLLETLGKFRRKSLIIYDPGWWDVIVNEDLRRVSIIDLESCQTWPNPTKIGYSLEVHEIIQDCSTSYDHYGYYSGPVDPEYISDEETS